MKKRTNYKNRVNLPGCKAGTLFTPHTSWEGALVIEGHHDFKEQSLVILPFDDEFFTEAGRAGEFTKEEMISFAKACVHNGLSEDKIAENLAHMIEVRIYG